MPPIPKSELAVKMRSAEQVLMITVCEGDGKDYPYQEVQYVVTLDGKILGKITRKWDRMGTLMY